MFEQQSPAFDVIFVFMLFRIIYDGRAALTFGNNKNSAEVDIAPAFGEITTACNVGQAKKGHGACLKSGQLVYARFHPHS